MNGLRLPMWALVKGAWRDSYNRGWRFSRAKSGFWALLLQLGLAGVVLWRLGGAPLTAAAGDVIMLGGFQAGLFSFLTLFLQGRRKLYTSPLVSLIHLSPTPAQAVVMAELLGQLPTRVRSGFLFTLVLGPVLPAETHLWSLPLLWLTVLLGGVLGHLTGLLALIFLVRQVPGALYAVHALALVLTLGFAYLLIYLLVVGLSPEEVAEVAGVAGRNFGLLLLLFLTLPGLLMLLHLIRTPGVIGESYREGWLGVMELGDRQSRPYRSHWPRLAAGPVGAVQALAWLMALRNWFSLIRVGLWVAGVAGLVLFAPLLRNLGERHATLVFLGVGLAMGLLN